MEQFLAAQTQLLTNMVNTIANMQAQMNQAPPQPPPPARDRHREFMSYNLPHFLTHLILYKLMTGSRWLRRC
jgi:hypothetical protein